MAIESFVENDWPIPATSPGFTVVFKDDGWYGLDKNSNSLVKRHVIALDPSRHPKSIDLYYLDLHGNPPISDDPSDP